MADMQKKIGAALAAVNAYLQDEEALIASQQEAGKFPSGPQSRISLWGQSGRQEMMDMRRLTQMRAFGRCR